VQQFIPGLKKVSIRVKIREERERESAREKTFSSTGKKHAFTQKGSLSCSLENYNHAEVNSEHLNSKVSFTLISYFIENTLSLKKIKNTCMT
jgi:hypothetical protein